MKAQICFSLFLSSSFTYMPPPPSCFLGREWGHKPTSPGPLLLLSFHLPGTDLFPVIPKISHSACIKGVEPRNPFLPYPPCHIYPLTPRQARAKAQARLAPKLAAPLADLTMVRSTLTSSPRLDSPTSKFQYPQHRAHPLPRPPFISPRAGPRGSYTPSNPLANYASRGLPPVQLSSVGLLGPTNPRVHPCPHSQHGNTLGASSLTV